jgi:hypothetical protein
LASFRNFNHLTASGSSALIRGAAASGRAPPISGRTNHQRRYHAGGSRVGKKRRVAVDDFAVIESGWLESPSLRAERSNPASDVTMVRDCFVGDAASQ